MCLSLVKHLFEMVHVQRAKQRLRYSKCGYDAMLSNKCTHYQFTREQQSHLLLITVSKLNQLTKCMTHLFIGLLQLVTRKLINVSLLIENNQICHSLGSAYEI